MALYVLTYDVRSTNHDYEPLYDLLEKWKAAHLQNSVWLARLSSPASEVRANMKKHMHADDTIAVIELSQTGDWATLRVRKEGSDWLHKNID